MFSLSDKKSTCLPTMQNKRILHFQMQTEEVMSVTFCICTERIFFCPIRLVFFPLYIIS